MRVVHPVCCGIDVHRSVIACTVATSPEGSLAATHGQRSFSTKWSDLLERMAELLSREAEGAALGRGPGGARLPS